MLKGTFFTIESLQHDQEESAQFELTLKPDHPVYEGHFPGEPVAPGVCLVQLVQECMEEVKGTPLKTSSIKNCKFLKVVNPFEDPVLHVELSYKTQEGELKFKAVGKQKEEICFKLDGIYA